jgi:hypothetical protein
VIWCILLVITVILCEKCTVKTKWRQSGKRKCYHRICLSRILFPEGCGKITLDLGVHVRSWCAYNMMRGARGDTVGWGTALQTGRSRVRFPMVSLEFFISFIRSHLASNRNEYQEFFLGGKRGRCVWLTTLPPSCADYLEIWEPQPSGNVRACPGL